MNKFDLVDQTVFPLKKAPLVHCITNTVTVETMANALLYIDAKPIMSEDVRGFAALFEQTDSLLLNLGSPSEKREAILLAAAKRAKGSKPFVIDLVGVASAPNILALARQLMENRPTVVRGNISEMRVFCKLKASSRGVDGSLLDQTEEGLQELILSLKKLDQTTVYLATGKKDVVVARGKAWIMENGVDELDRFTGSGDILGAMIAALLGEGYKAATAVLTALSYLNICGEEARHKLPLAGLADFRHETLNQLSLLAGQNTKWFCQVKGVEQ